MANRKPNAALIRDNAASLVADGKATVQLPKYLAEIYDDNIWQEWTNAIGEPFESFLDAATANQPYGLGLGQYHGWVSVSQAYELCHGFKRVQRALQRKFVEEQIEEAKNGKVIAKHGEIGNGRSRGDNITSTQRGTSVEYLMAVMVRNARSGDKKAIAALEGLETGRLTSVRQAAIKCGIVKPNGSDKDRCPIQRIKMYWKRANEYQRNELLAWLKTAEAKLTRKKH